MKTHTHAHRRSEIVVGHDQHLREGLARELADALGGVFGTARDSGRTWVKVREIPHSQYAEQGGAVGDVQPVFVRVLTAKRPEGELLKQEMMRVTMVIASALDRRAENVHVIYEADAQGRIAFGGKLVED